MSPVSSRQAVWDSRVWGFAHPAASEIWCSQTWAAQSPTLSDPQPSPPVVWAGLAVYSCVWGVLNFSGATSQSNCPGKIWILRCDFKFVNINHFKNVISAILYSIWIRFKNCFRFKTQMKTFLIKSEIILCLHWNSIHSKLRHLKC